MAKPAKDWKKHLATLVRHKDLEKLLEKDPTGQRFLFQCSLDLSHVPADQHILRNPDLPEKISKAIKKLFQMTSPAIIPIHQKQFQEKFDEFKGWLLDKTGQMQTYLNVEKTLSPTKIPSSVKIDRVAILFCFFRSRGFSERDTVEKVYAFLSEANIVAKPYRELKEPEITNLKKQFLRDVSISLKEKEARAHKEKPKSKKQILLELRRFELRRAGFGVEKI